MARPLPSPLEIGAPAVEPLINALKGTDKSVRRDSAWALGMIGDVRAVEPLIVTLKDWYRHVRYTAAEALDKLGFQPDKGEVGAAYWAAKKKWDRCVEIGAPAVHSLRNALEDEDVREAVVEALNQIYAQPERQ